MRSLKLEKANPSAKSRMIAPRSMSSGAASMAPTEGSTNTSGSFGQRTSSLSPTHLGKRKADEAFPDGPDYDRCSGMLPPSLPSPKNKSVMACLDLGFGQLSLGVDRPYKPGHFSKALSSLSGTAIESSHHNPPDGNDFNATVPQALTQTSPGDILVRNLFKVRFRFWDFATGVECTMLSTAESQVVIVCTLLLNERLDGDCELPRQEEECKLTFIMLTAEFDKEEQNSAQPGEEMGPMTRLLIECNERSSHSEPSEEGRKPPDCVRWSQAFPVIATDETAKIRLFNKLAERWLQEKRWLMLDFKQEEDREGLCSTTSSASRIGLSRDL